MIYLDNSATSYPKPPAVWMAMQQALREYGANPGRSGYEMSVRTTQRIYECRKTVADFFGAGGPECVVFTPNCTQALNQVLKGLLKKGDHVVVSDLEHNAVMRPLAALADRGVSYTVVSTSFTDNDETLDGFRKAFTPKTRLVVCTQASNVFGVRMPVERLAALAHQYEIEICVDAAQSAGLVPINIQDSGIDYLCAAGHKGLYGPMGTGILVFRNPAHPLATLVEGGTGTQSRSLEQPEEPPERYESGTQNVPGIIGLQAGIRFVSQKGPENIWKTEMQKIELAYERLQRLPAVRLYTPAPHAPYFFPVLSFNVEDVPSEQVGEYLARKGIGVRCGLHCAPMAHEKMGTTEGTVRISPSAFTRREEIESFARAMKNYRMEKGNVRRK